MVVENYVKRGRGKNEGRCIQVEIKKQLQQRVALFCVD